MSKNTFGRRLSNALKSYRNNGENIKNLIVEAIEFARDNNNQTVYCQKILDAMEGNDIRDVSRIMTKFAPFVINDGMISLSKSKKERKYHVDYDLVQQYRSFRSLAEALKDTKETEATFDMAKYAETVLKRLAKEGVDLAVFEKTLDTVATKVTEKA